MKKDSCFFSLLILLFLFSSSTAQAQTLPPEKNVLLVIGNFQGAYNAPVQKYLINEDQLFLIDQWQVVTHDLGPVGMAVDETNQQFFLSYEGSDIIEAFSTEDGSGIGEIVQAGVDDFAGIVVHQGRGRLFAVDRNTFSVYVYDAATLAFVENWTLADEAWGIDLMGDFLYVTDTTSDVHWYNIDTHVKTGTIHQAFTAVGIAVTDYPEQAIYTQSWSIVSPDDTEFRRYDVLNGVESSAYVGPDTKGLSLNPAGEVGYSITEHFIHVVDLETMTVENTVTLNWTWVPTDCVAATLDMSGKIIKTCTSHPDGEIHKGDQVDFTIKVFNVNSAPIHELVVSDQYDPAHFEFVSSSPSTDDNVNDGLLHWSDLVGQIGHDMAVGETVTITVHFTALEDCGEDLELFGANEAAMSNVFDDQANALPGDDSSFAYTIDCHCKTDRDCNDGIDCNGEEICRVDGSCSDPEDLCPAGKSCNQTLDRCLPVMGLENFGFQPYE